MVTFLPNSFSIHTHSDHQTRDVVFLNVAAAQALGGLYALLMALWEQNIRTEYRSLFGNKNLTTLIHDLKALISFYKLSQSRTMTTRSMKF